MSKLFVKLDFGILGFRFVVLYIAFFTLSSVVFSPFTISVDGFSYLKSSEVLFGPDFGANYTWIREPGYPLFIRLLEDLGGLLLVFATQALILTFGIVSTHIAFYRALGVSQASWKSYVSAGIAIILLAGYASTLLQQAIFVGLFGLLLLTISRIIRLRSVDALTGVFVFTLILFSTITAVFIGLAFGLALFGTLIMTRVFKLKTLISYSSIALTAFLLVMIPWTQIKDSNGPSDAPDSLEIGASSAFSLASGFNPEKELFELFQTQAALLNIGGEFPPSSGLGVANENRIFGAPVYNADNKCGRFLTGADPDSLWGKIETQYRDRCVKSLPLSLISFVNRIFHLVYPFVGLALVFGFLLSLRINSSLRALTIPGFLALTPYLLLDASISRYGAFLIPLGAALLVEFMTSKQKVQNLNQKVS